MTDPDVVASTGQGLRRRADQPVRLILTAHSAQPSQPTLGDWLRRYPEYRGAVRDTGERRDGRAGFSDAVVIAVVAQALLPGLFRVLQTWVAQQRRETRVRIRVGESEVEFQVTGRTDPTALLAEVTRSLPAVAGQAPAEEAVGSAGHHRRAVDGGPVPVDEPDQFGEDLAQGSVDGE